jgi:hypothetical protein
MSELKSIFAVGSGLNEIVNEVVDSWVAPVTAAREVSTKKTVIAF